MPVSAGTAKRVILDPEAGKKILTLLIDASTNPALKADFESILSLYIGCMRPRQADPVDSLFEYFSDELKQQMVILQQESIKEIITALKANSDVVKFLKSLNPPEECKIVLAPLGINPAGGPITSSINLLGPYKMLVFNPVIKSQNLEKYSEYDNILFQYLVKNFNDYFVLEETFKILLNNYYLGKDCDYLKYDIRKNIRLLSIISYIRNNINFEHLKYQYEFLMHIIKLQFNILERYCPSKYNENPPPPPPRTITRPPPDKEKWCTAIALKYPIRNRINNLIWLLFHTVGSRSGGEFHKLVELSITNPVEFEKEYVKQPEQFRKAFNKYSEISRESTLSRLEEYSSQSGEIFHLNNLRLQHFGFTQTALLQENNIEELSPLPSPYNSLKAAMEDSIIRERQNDASFNTHYGTALHMVNTFKDIKLDLQNIGIDINLNDSNIVYQLMSLSVRFENTNHPINQSIPTPVRVPC